MINPVSDILKKDMPVIVLSDNLRSFLAWGIKSHSSGNYNHVMMMIRPGFVVTQSWMYKEIPMSRYMTKKHRLKFWKPELTQEEKEDVISGIELDLKASWWKRKYDLLGIVGQLIHLRWLNNPFTSYCSERVAASLKIVSWLYKMIPKKPSPADINRAFQKKEKIILLGRWFAD